MLGNMDALPTKSLRNVYHSDNSNLKHTVIHEFKLNGLLIYWTDNNIDQQFD